jgi:hypothetical protein
MEEFLLSKAYSSRELLLFNKEHMNNDTYADRIPRVNDQTNIKFLKQQEFNANIVKRLEELEDFKSQATIKIAQLENKVEALQLWKYNIETKLERIDDILVVHRNQIDTQYKNHVSLIKVWDEKVLLLIEGKHGR